MLHRSSSWIIISVLLVALNKMDSDIRDLLRDPYLSLHPIALWTRLLRQAPVKVVKGGPQSPMWGTARNRFPKRLRHPVLCRLKPVIFTLLSALTPGSLTSQRFSHWWGHILLIVLLAIVLRSQPSSVLSWCPHFECLGVISCPTALKMPSCLSETRNPRTCPTYKLKAP